MNASALSLPDRILLHQTTVPLIWQVSLRAKRTAFRLDPEKRALIITLPLRSSPQTALTFVRENEAHILKKLAILPEPLKIKPDVFIPIRGQNFKIIHCPADKNGVLIEGNNLKVSGQAEFLARRVQDFLKKEAKRHFCLVIAEKTATLSRKPAKITVKDTKSRWGSCSSSGHISLSWRLIMAPDFVIDYVISHELGHLFHLNHSKAFWQQTEALTPYKQQAEAWLKRCGSSLMSIG